MNHWAGAAGQEALGGRVASASACPVWQADPAWSCIDLLSDVHLQIDRPATFAAWRQHLLGTPADAVLILGDLFEVWVGDDARSGRFEAECAAVLKASARHRRLAFMPGNRDFLVGDAFLAETGVQRLADPSLLLAWGRRWLLSHGDALCLADTAYLQFRQQVRGLEWQARFLALPLAERQHQARTMRNASAAHQARQGPTGWSEVDHAAATDWLLQTGAEALIHGHTHRPGAHALPGGLARHVLGDWDFEAPPARGQILRLTAAGLQALDLGAAAP
jgi:UDP-2,3-diacylglucosamine hydrolase